MEIISVIELAYLENGPDLKTCLTFSGDLPEGIAKAEAHFENLIRALEDKAHGSSLDHDEVEEAIASGFYENEEGSVFMHWSTLAE